MPPKKLPRPVVMVWRRVPAESVVMSMRWPVSCLVFQGREGLLAYLAEPLAGVVSTGCLDWLGAADADGWDGFAVVHGGTGVGFVVCFLAPRGLVCVTRQHLAIHPP